MHDGPLFNRAAQKYANVFSRGRCDTDFVF
jgi:hypothetical protein